MSYTYGANPTYCDVCGRHDLWGCGHTGSQRYSARRHNATAIHRTERCHHYTAPARDGWYPAHHSVEYIEAHPEQYRGVVVASLWHNYEL